METDVASTTTWNVMFEHEADCYPLTETDFGLGCVMRNIACWSLKSSGWWGEKWLTVCIVFGYPGIIASIENGTTSVLFTGLMPRQHSLTVTMDAAFLIYKVHRTISAATYAFLSCAYVIISMPAYPLSWNSACILWRQLLFYVILKPSSEVIVWRWQQRPYGFAMHLVLGSISPHVRKAWLQAKSLPAKMQ